MITFKNKNIKLNNSSYTNFIGNFDFCNVKCTCGSCSLVKFGKYHRGVKINGMCISFDIQRVFCKACNRTHAILPMGIIPYMQLSLDDALDICVNLNEDTVDKADTEAVDVLKRFKLWKARLNAIKASLKEGIDHILEICSSFFKMCFLQKTRRQYCNHSKFYEVIYFFVPLST